jgi:hypothetical protein
MANKLHMLSQKYTSVEEYSFLFGIIAFIFVILGLFLLQTRLNSSQPYQNTSTTTNDIGQVSANESISKKVVDIHISNETGFSTREVIVPKNTQLVLQFTRSADEAQGIFFPAHDQKSFQFIVGEKTHTVVFEPFLQAGEHDFLASIYTGNLNVFKSMKGVIKVTE